VAPPARGKEVACPTSLSKGTSLQLDRYLRLYSGHSPDARWASGSDHVG